MHDIFDRLWHQKFRRPYRLARKVDIGHGAPVILLHGLGSSSSIWQHVVKRMPETYRIIAFDLLGFGTSPKPAWPDYSVDDHANAVIAGMGKLKLRQPVTFVGHSMGCLVAVRVARLRPDLVSRLVLYEMPLYDGLPEKSHYRLRLNVYRAIYKRIINFEPQFTVEKARLVQRLAVRIAGLKVTEQTWVPFKRSLENTIMNQTAADDIKHISTPMDVIYGRRDMLVIRGKPVKIFGEDISSRITSHTINASHSIPLSASAFLVARITDTAKKSITKTIAKTSKQA